VEEEKWTKRRMVEYLKMVASPRLKNEWAVTGCVKAAMRRTNTERLRGAVHAVVKERGLEEDFAEMTRRLPVVEEEWDSVVEEQEEERIWVENKRKDGRRRRERERRRRMVESWKAAFVRLENDTERLESTLERVERTFATKLEKLMKLARLE
jgi:hypothetical protein